MSESNKDFLTQVTIAFQKLSPTKDDVVLMYMPEKMPVEQLEAAASMLQNIQKEHNCSILILKQGMLVECLDEQQMFKHGWVRVDRLDEDVVPVFNSSNSEH